VKDGKVAAGRFPAAAITAIETLARELALAELRIEQLERDFEDASAEVDALREQPEHR
jgi:hypothetical protein